jgi:hypothetical protein
MKKILLTTAMCLIGAASLMAQGRIIFANSSTTPIQISNPQINGGVASILGTGSTAAFGIGPASVRISLFAGLSSGSLSPVLIGTAANQTYVTNTASGIASAQGTFAGGNPLPLPGFDGSAPVFLQMIIESFTGSVPYKATSSIISVTPALSPAAATTVFGAAGGPNLWNSASFTMVPVPEPSSMALAGLGAASLLLFRRRK